MAIIVQLYTLGGVWRLFELPKLASLVLLLLAPWCHYYGMLASADTCFCFDTLPQYTTSSTNCANAIRKVSWCPGPVKDPLLNATIMLNVTGVKAALGSGADVNATSSREYIRGLAPLQVALLTTSEPFWHPYTEAVYLVIKALLDAGADPNAPFPLGTYHGSQEYAGMTPLQYVAHDGQTELVRRLIKAGADVNARGRGGRTGLQEAAMCPLDVEYGERMRVPGPAMWGDDYSEVMRLLLDAGADVNAVDDGGHTAYQLSPDYTTSCPGTAGLGPTCITACQVARRGVRGVQQYYSSYYNASRPRGKGDCCVDPDMDQRSLDISQPASGLNYSRCCLAYNGFMTTK